MKLYVLCITPRNLIDVDRRVLNQCEIFADLGWDVHLIVPNTMDHTEKHGKITLVSFTFVQASMQDLALVDTFVFDNTMESSSQHSMPYSIQITESLYKTENELKSREILKQSTSQVNPATRYIVTRFFLDMLKKGQPDAVYCADYHGMVAANIYHREFKKPYVIDSHEYCLSHQNYHTTEQAFVKKVESKCFQNTTALVTVSQTFAELYQFEYGLDRLPLIYHNTPKPSVKNAEKMQTWNLRKNLAIDNTKKIILFHGGLARVKRNLEMLLQISVELAKQDIHLLFIGYGPLLTDIMKYKAINSSVHYLPTLDQESLALVIKQVDAIIVPYIALDINQKYCAPNRFFDALTHRIFVIANDSIDSIKGIVNQFKVGYVGAMDKPESMYQTILNAFEHQKNHKTYENTELLDACFGFDAQKQTMITVSNLLEYEIKKQKLEDLQLFDLLALVESRIDQNLEKGLLNEATALLAQAQHMTTSIDADSQQKILDLAKKIRQKENPNVN